MPEYVNTHGSGCSADDPPPASAGSHGPARSAGAASYGSARGRGSAWPAGPPPAAPGVAREIFGEALDVAEHYASMLAGPAVQRGLIGPNEVPRLWHRHILNCAVVADLIAVDRHVVDLGSGAGLPGIPLAIARSDLRVTLLESAQRRCAFLSECVKDLGLDSVDVRRARAEDVAVSIACDVVVARAVGPLDRLAAWSLPLLVSGGTLLAIKGERAAEELDRARSRLARLGGGDLRLLSAGQGKVEPPTAVVHVVRGEASAGRVRRSRSLHRRGSWRPRRDT